MKDILKSYPPHKIKIIILLIVFMYFRTSPAILCENGPYLIQIELPDCAKNNTKNDTAIESFDKDINIYYFNFKTDNNEKLVVTLVEYSTTKNNLNYTSNNVKEVLIDSGAWEGDLKTNDLMIDECLDGRCRGAWGGGPLTYTMAGQRISIYAVQYWKDSCIKRVHCTLTSRFSEEESDLIFKNFKIICKNVEMENV